MPRASWGRNGKCARASPCPPGQTTTLMDVDGPGCIQHSGSPSSSRRYRDLILRIYWDGEEHPSVEAPLGDFFCNGLNTRTNILALPINVNPSGGFNCYFPMPFRRHARMTIENRAPENVSGFFYAINYAQTEIDDDDAYFHAQFRRTNPLPYLQDYTILDGVRGQGQYVGTYMAWQQNSSGWWGEGEIKIFLDGDTEFPTICGTGTEDYFGGAWCFDQTFSAPFMGYPLGASDGDPAPPGRVGNRHGLYRFHIMDPIRFRQDLRVTMQAIGWRSEGRYLPAAGRHRLGRLLVPGGTACALPGAAGSEWAGGDLALLIRLTCLTRPTRPLVRSIQRVFRQAAGYVRYKCLAPLLSPAGSFPIPRRVRGRRSWCPWRGCWRRSPSTTRRTASPSRGCAPLTKRW